MDILKTGLMLVVALAVGAVVGMYYNNATLAPELAALQETNAQAHDRIAELDRQLADLAGRNRGLEAQNAVLRDQVDGLNAQIDSLRQAAAPVPVAPAPPVEETGPTDLEALLASGNLNPDAAPDDTPRARPGRSAQDRLRDIDRSGQGRSEFMLQVRQRTQDLMAQEMARTNDPAARQRLQSISENADYMMDLVQQLRELPDGPDREALRQEFERARDTMSGLVRDQQDYALRQVAAQHGISDPAQQQAFIEALRETESSPLFQAPMLTWGPPIIARDPGLQ